MKKLKKCLYYFSNSNNLLSSYLFLRKEKNMNKNLVKILALSSIALALGACGGNKKPSEPVSELTVAEAFDLNDDGTFLNEGKLVKFDSICVYGNYGNTYVCGVPYVEGGDIRNLKGFEVELSAKPNWQGETKGRYANVDVTGRLANVNGRPVIQEASIEINAEARYDEEGNRDENDGAYSAGYWGTDLFVRDYYDEYMTRKMNGTLIEGVFQIASKPGELSTSSEASFQVVFPGENLDLEDPDNYSLINVTIPAGLDEEVITKTNTFLNSVEAGDFVDLMGITRWDTSKGGMGILLENWWTKYAAEATEDQIPEILSSWAEVSTVISPLYNQPVVDLSGANEEDPLNAPFSYLIDDSNYEANPRDYWTDAYKDILVVVSDPEACGTVKITANLKASDADAYYDAIFTKLEGLGFVSSTVESGIYVFSRAESEEVVEEVLLMAYETSAQIYYTAPRIVVDADFETVTLASAAYNVRVSELLDSAFTTALPGAASELIANVNFSWAYEMYYYNKYQFTAYDYEFEISFVAEATAEQIAALAQSYQAAIAGAGFVEAYQSTLGVQGLWNAATGEFIAALELTEESTLYLDVMVLSGEMADDVSLRPTSSAEMLAMINGEYAGWNGVSAKYFPTTTSSVTSFALGELTPVSFGFLDNTYNSMGQTWGSTPFFVASINYNRDLAQEDVALFVAQLTSAGFVQASHAAFGAGYWNATTFEFIKVSSQKNTLNVGFGLVPTPVATQLITVVEAGE